MQGLSTHMKKLLRGTRERAGVPGLLRSSASEDVVPCPHFFREKRFPICLSYLSPLCLGAPCLENASVHFLFLYPKIISLAPGVLFSQHDGSSTEAPSCLLPCPSFPCSSKSAGFSPFWFPLSPFVYPSIMLVRTA